MPPEQPKQIEPTHGFPITHTIKDDEGVITGYGIHARHLTPMRARISDKLSLLAGIAALYGLFKLTDSIQLEWYIILFAYVIIPIAVPWVTRYAFYELFKKNTVVKFETERFHRCGFVQRRTYDRNISHSFAIYRHHRAEGEDRICAALERLLPRVLTLKPFKRYIGASRYIAFEYMDQRQDLMLVYKERTARKILARLNACDKLMDGVAGNGRGEVLKPEAEWSNHGGSIETANI